ncbi:MAG: hypothetical protein H8E86_02750 [Planctomycetes bacterium]|nr:hypothetical protein [Planctomycetota bacterium]
MKNILLIIICSILGSVVVTLVSKSLGVASPAAVGGGFGGAVAAVLSMKLYGKKQR